MKQLNTYIKYYLLVFLLAFVVKVSAQDVPEKPSLETSYYEIGTTLLEEAQKREIEQKLINYADTTSTQIVVVVVPTTGGEYIDRYKVDLAHKWGIGQKDKDNGILLLIAKDDRKVAIASGYGTEHLLTDAMSKRIIEDVILPEFKNGDFYAGIDEGTNAIFKVMSGEYIADEKSDKIAFGAIFLFIIIFIIIIAMISRKGGGGGGRRYGSTLSDVLILGSLGRSGGSFGSSSGGGFGGGGFSGGFGGGGFGGGGASGGW
ncbi:YgcG family protein [Flavobacterium sp. MK4S-17]|uniref:TPM domain-containing protein n=1 Tax=Flavobacterium sp. MK4S-17 TaxID=2543737 RepID=UPI001358FC26|nr:TPM domain-containing protein [Flavobacterium sp. MK4S-17]